MKAVRVRLVDDHTLARASIHTRLASLEKETYGNNPDFPGR